MIDWQKDSLFDGPDNSPGFLLWQVSTLWQRKINHSLKELDLTHPQFVLLANISWLTRDKNIVSQADLSQKTKMDINLVSQLIKRLENKKLLYRFQKEDNQKNKYSVLTEKGQKLIKKALSLVEQADTQFFQLTTEKRQGFIELMDLLRKESL